MEKRDPETLKQLAQGHTAAEGRAGAQRGCPVLGGKASPPSGGGEGPRRLPGTRVSESPSGDLDPSLSSAAY